MSATTLSETTAHVPAKPRSLELTAWQWIVGLLGLTTLVLLVVYLVAAVQMVQRPFPGMMVTRTLTVNLGQPTANADWPAFEAGMKPGDFITALNGQELFSNPDNYDFNTARTRYSDILSGLSVGESLTVDFIRRNYTDDVSFCTALDNGSAECSVTLSLTSFPELDFIFYFGLAFGSGLFITLLGLALFRWRNNHAEGLAGAAIAFLSAIYAAGIFDTGTTAIMTPVWLLAGCWLGGSLTSLGLIFPRRLAAVRQAPWLRYLPILATTLAGLYIVYAYLTPTSPYNNQFAQLASMLVVAGIIMLILLVLIQRERAADPVSRDQSNSLFIGTAMMMVPTAVWFSGRLLFSQTGSSLLNVEVLTPLYMFPNVAIAYSVLQYRRVDTDRVISQGLTYSMMVIVLIISMYLLSLGGSLLAITWLNASNVVVIALILLAMVALFTPLRQNLQERMDALYFQKRRDYQTRVENFSRRLAGLNTYKDVVQEYRRLIRESVAPSAMFIYLQEREGDPFTAYNSTIHSTDIRFSPNSDMIKMLRDDSQIISLQPGQTWPHQLWADRNRLQVLKARLIVPITGTDRLNGFVILAPPRDDQAIYGHDEVRFIDNLSSQFAIATERSQVIESLEQRVRELDVLSQVGQAVNFTVEFDDLLELIYAQTSKLVDVPNFYIALYKDRIDQMYFAFLLEDNERYNEREGIRRDLGDDLFSLVIKENDARRVSNFQQEMDTRRASLEMVRDNLYAWIGVPLTAGRRKIGVMAAGKTRPGSEYTEEQFKIFRDIGALAATSLDKANLFTQTRMRERQLTVLNDISRQLVATESDVERLLEIIMNSAVDILNAEAGSLLLDTEDDTHDLEFRVVIGGAGDELLGTRISRGKGIVGQVVETGEPLIVNNAADDPRHMQGVADEFVSESLMAVPLIAKEGVIGVLEIINKKDGTPFLDEEAELLTTFAGQAAIAIENARLFQMTDRQLSQRVEELETLERIDSELNRTLELGEVAKITVRSTMRVLEASAGALGIVQQSPPRLEIVAIEGYSEDEYPEGADGLYWPLDSGIVGRVMRSRQADIAMDVNQDPDYNSKHESSNSQITLPMISGDEVNAILILEKNTQPRFSLPDWAFAQRIAEHASIAIANAQFYAALMQANESKSEFMGFAAHELKNPLSSVTGYADVLKGGMVGELNEKQLDFIQVIHSNAERMKTIISDLRDAARMESNQFSVDVEPMNIHHAVVETLRPYVHVLEDKDQELINDVPEDLPLVMGDEKRLIQVLTNLVSNAHKYSPAGTKIRVYAKHIERYTDKRGQKRGEMIQVSVEDEGLGISEADQKRLFKERYFRSTNPEAIDQPGTGLGMMLTEGIIKQHEGEIWVDSTLGEGSTFSFAIPVVDEKKMKDSADAEEAKASNKPQTEPASD